MADVPTTSWSETSPAGSDNISAGDNRIREMKTQVREVIDVDHDFPSSGQAADVGQHKQVTLQEQADLGTGAEGVPILGAQTIDDKAELVFTDEDDNDVQITTGGKIKAESISGVYPAADVAAIANILELVYPIGSYYFNDSDDTNPATLLGIGTWSAVEGRVLVGKEASGTFETAQEELGAETVTLTAAQSGLPAHTHVLNMTDGSGGALTLPGQQGSRAATHTGVTGAVSGGAASASEAHSNLQPSRTVYIWRRTA